MTMETGQPGLLGQQRRMTPEEAVVALGMLTEDQVVAIYTGEPARASA
jgi:hypothetical protein